MTDLEKLDIKTMDTSKLRTLEKQLLNKEDKTSEDNVDLYLITHELLERDEARHEGLISAGLGLVAAISVSALAYFVGITASKHVLKNAQVETHVHINNEGLDRLAECIKDHLPKEGSA